MHTSSSNEIPRFSRERSRLNRAFSFRSRYFGIGVCYTHIATPILDERENNSFNKTFPFLLAVIRVSIFKNRVLFALIHISKMKFKLIFSRSLEESSLPILWQWRTRRYKNNFSFPFIITSITSIFTISKDYRFDDLRLQSSHKSLTAQFSSR